MENETVESLLMQGFQEVIVHPIHKPCRYFKKEDEASGNVVYQMFHYKGCRHEHTFHHFDSITITTKGADALRN